MPSVNTFLAKRNETAEEHPFYKEYPFTSIQPERLLIINSNVIQQESLPPAAPVNCARLHHRTQDPAPQDSIYHPNSLLS